MSASGIQLIFCQSLGKCLYVLMHRKGHSTYRYNQYYRPNMMPAFRKYLFYKMPKMSMTTLLSTSDYDGGPAHFGTLHSPPHMWGYRVEAGPEMRLLFIKSKSFLVTMYLFMRLEGEFSGFPLIFLKDPLDGEFSNGRIFRGRIF